MKFRKKPVVIEATQWHKNGDHPHDDRDMFDYPDEKGYVFQRPGGEGKVVRYYRHPSVPGERPCEQCGNPHHAHGWIDTLEQGHRVCPGDWIITGVKGEMYPCKPDIFAATYEPAGDKPPAAMTPAEAYAAGWRACASWAQRDDLLADIDSPAYVAEFEAVIRSAPKDQA